jgi:uridine kinase
MVRVRLDGRDHEVPHATPVGQILDRHHQPGSQPPLAAIVHNRGVDLSYPVCADSEITPVEYTMREGVLVYRRTASLILLEAARQLFPGVRVSIGQALGNGYFYYLRLGDALSRRQMQRLKKRMREIVAAELPLETRKVSLEEARQIFAALGHQDKLQLLETYWEPFITLVRCGEFTDIHHQPVAPHTGFITHFQLVHYPPGLIMRFPPRGKPKPIRRYMDSPGLFQVYRETREWNEILGVENVGQLNQRTVGGVAAMLIRVAEGLHEKKVARIADQIGQGADHTRLVTIAGPSA